MKKLTPAEAFRRYAEMPDRTRAGVYNLLKQDGYKVARKTIEKWHAEEKWDDKLANAVVLKAAEKAAVITIDAAMAETLEETMPNTARMIEGLSKLVLACAPNVTIQTVEELRTLALIVTNTAESMAKVRKTLAEANGGAADTGSIEAVRMQGSENFLEATIAEFRKMREQATDA